MRAIERRYSNGPIQTVEREIRVEKVDLEPTVEVIGSITEVVAAKARGKEVYLIMK